MDHTDPGPMFTQQAFSTGIIPQRYKSPIMGYREGQWLKEQLARLTYKPNVTMSIVPSPGIFYQAMGAEWSLQIIMSTEDTYHPGNTLEVYHLSPLYHADMMDEDRFINDVATALKDMEIHESREWLKRDGAIWDDPHK